ncbi:hypothetical protein M5X06_18695 [Paenibacillus alvei]|uniref:Uncharacterized protein n=1 Tax=Paenibacillus alvei TaxID=44250 RepID=A0ABT4GW30_PAEAL|nr:hypothetical protein [Paenibacillus alvei]MCY9760913.1 hypothetical protein [Paenibacillus alvei]MCY9768833.1 hypothetical protein [Paenibacillus alvei]
MRKVKLTIRETLVYEREAIVLMPDGIPGSINDQLDNAERRSDSASEVVYELGNNGCEIVENVSRDMDCPVSEEVEIIDYEFLEEDAEDE